MSKGTIDTLMEVGWVQDQGPQAHARPPGHLRHDGGLPGPFRAGERRPSAGHWTNSRRPASSKRMPPSGFDVPSPSDMLAPDEDPYTGEEENDLATGGPDLDQI